MTPIKAPDDAVYRVRRCPVRGVWMWRDRGPNTPAVSLPRVLFLHLNLVGYSGERASGGLAALVVDMLADALGDELRAVALAPALIRDYLPEGVPPEGCKWPVSGLRAWADDAERVGKGGEA